MQFLMNYWWLILAIIIVFTGLVTVNQGTIAVITMFGKYRRILMPGLNFKIPILEQVYKTVSIQDSFSCGFWSFFRVQENWPF